MTKGQVRWGGDEGTRTLNPRLAKAVRYQLRHVPAAAHDSGRRELNYRTELPGRSGASAGRWPGSPSRGRLVPEVSFLGGSGFLTEGQETPDGGGYEQQLLHSDPTPLGAGVGAVSAGWPERQRFPTGGSGSPLWAWEDLNLRPHPYQGCALTA